MQADAPRADLPSREETRLNLPKESLIRRRAEYSAVYAEGRRVHTRHFLLFVAPPIEGEDGIRLGTAVSRKVGHAVVRNRIKRLLREVYRLQALRMPFSARVVVVAKKHAGTDDLGLAEVMSEIASALQGHFRTAEAK